MENQEQKTGVIYCRVSSQEQVSNTSLEGQERFCRDYAKREGIKILKVFVEEGESAKTANRTEFNKAILLCSNKKQKVGYFIVYKVDRFARNQDDHAVVRATLKKYGTVLRSVTEPIDETPVGRLMEGVISSVAEFDNSIRSERSKNGMMELMKKGYWVWPAPIGYKRLVKGGNLVQDETSAPYIKLAFEEWKKGIHSFKSLADYLSERGFKTRSGKKAFPQLLEKILKNPIYCGLIRVWGMEVKGQFAPIVGEELFLDCQAGPRRRFGANKRESANPDFPLRKHTLCPVCSTPLTGSYSRGNGGKYAYYHHQKKGCSNATYIPKETLEQNFVEFLREISPNNKFTKVFKEIIRDVWQSNYKKLDSDNIKIRKEIEVLEGERQRIFDFHRDGKYSDSEFLEQKDLVNMNIQQKKLLLEDKRVEEFSMDEALDSTFRLVGNSAKTWKELENLPVYRARFQKQAFPEKLTFDGEKFGTTKMSPILKLNEEYDGKKSNLVTPQRIEL
ncbi:MAG: recombinase family protein [Patescibacteria group bacterium]